MGDMGDVYRLNKKASQNKRANNRLTSPQLLISNNIQFTIKNYGNHLIVEAPSGLIDFWPGTGKWITRKGVHGRGVRNLIKRIQSEVLAG